MRFRIIKYGTDLAHDDTEIEYEFTAVEIDEVMEKLATFFQACGFDFEIQTEEVTRND